MRKWMIRLSAVVMVSVIVFGAAGSALAQGPDSPRRGPDLRDGGPRERLVRVLLRHVMDTTGLELAEIVPDLRGGLTLTELLTEQGVDPQTVTDAVKTELEAEIQQAVTDGNITQERADALLASLDTALNRAMNASFATPLRDRALDRVRARADSTLIGVLAELAGVEPRELLRETLTPPTLAEIAEANGIDINAVIAAAETRITEEVNQAVADGHMTQEEADELLAGLHERLVERVNNPLRLNLRERIGSRGGTFDA